MDLNSVCFIFFSILFIGYLALEGFDYGVGMLLPFLGKTDMERQAIIRTLAPVWEGNEVWLIAAGAFLFAGFPDAYATLFSGMYLALLLILVTLICRGAGFEFRDKDACKLWRNVWDWSIFLGGLIPAFLWGIALSSLIKGLPVNAQFHYIGTFGDLISLYTLTGGAVFSLLFLIHGTAYLTLKLDVAFLNRLIPIGMRLGKITISMLAFFGILTLLNTDIDTKLPACLFLFMPVIAIYLVVLNLHTRRFVRCFIFSTVSVVSLSLSIFGGLFPRIVVSSMDSRLSLTIYNTSSNPLTLKIMSLTALIVLILILAIEIWKYHIFRQRITLADIQLATCSATLTPMLRELKMRLKYAHFLADTTRSMIDALRSDDGNVIGRLEPKSLVFMFKKLPHKFLHKKNN